MEAQSSKSIQVWQVMLLLEMQITSSTVRFNRVSFSMYWSVKPDQDFCMNFTTQEHPISLYLIFSFPMKYHHAAGRQENATEIYEWKYFSKQYLFMYQT